MKTWLTSRRETFKLVGAWSGCLLVVCGVWLTSVLYLLENAREAKTIRLAASRVRIHELEARRAEKDFVFRSRLDEGFFRDGHSEYVEKHEAHMAALRNEIETLGEHVSAQQKPTIEHLRYLVSRYERGFRELVTAYRDRGFRDWGLEGDLTKALAKLGRAVAQRKRPDLMLALASLARNQQAFLYHRDVLGADQVASDLQVLRANVVEPSSGSPSPDFLSLVDEYAGAFAKIRDLEERIGFTEDQGLQGQFRDAIHAVEPVVEEILVEAVRADENAHRTLLLGLLVTCLIMAILLALAVFFAQIARVHNRRLVQVNEQMEEEHRKLLQSERLAAIGQMVTGLAHESRNAIQRTHACLDMLSQEVKDRPDALRLVSRVEESQDQLHLLYEQVREYAAPLQVRCEPARLDEIVGRAWQRLDLLTEGRTVRFTQYTDNADLLGEVDGFAIEQVFRNIFENSLAACADPVEIEVRYRERDTNVRSAIEISVGDNGPGLDEAQRTRIFDPFYTTKTKGTGLGMAIAKRLVDAHGGIIEVGAGGKPGAEIIVTLPRRQERDS